MIHEGNSSAMAPAPQWTIAAVDNARKDPRRQLVRSLCGARGITIEQRQHSYLLRAPGIDLRVADLADVELGELAPYQPRKLDR